MYERRIEHSLYKTILELQRLNLIRKLDPANGETGYESLPGYGEALRQDELAGKV